MKLIALGDIATIERNSVNAESIIDGTIYVGLENITGEGTFENVAPVSSGELGSSKFQFNESHVLYGKLRPYLKKTALPTFSGICSTDILPIKPSSLLDRRYLFYYLRQQSIVDFAASQCTGINLPRLSPQRLNEFVIPLPPLAEQKRIAAILDQADALRVKRRAALARLDRLVQAVFLEMFGDPVTNPMGWEEKELHETAIRFSDGPFGSNLKTEHYTASGIRVIRLQNIGIGYLDDNDQAFVSEEHYQSLPRHHCEPDDIIIGTMGEPNLRACIIPQSLKRSLNKADCILYRVNRELVTPEYACWLLNNPRTIQKAEQLSLGQTRLRISMGRLKNLLVPVPPLEHQIRFTKSLGAISRMIFDYEKSSAKSDELFHALQQRAFRGEL